MRSVYILIVGLVNWESSVSYIMLEVKIKILSNFLKQLPLNCDKELKSKLGQSSGWRRMTHIKKQLGKLKARKSRTSNWEKLALACCHKNKPQQQLDTARQAHTHRERETN